MNNILIIANPVSGKYKIFKVLLPYIIEILKAKADNVELILTKNKGDGENIAKVSNANIVIAAGGDGLINEVAKGIIDTNKLFYALAFGTKNVFCKEYGISSNPLKAAKLLNIKNIKKIPVGYIDNKIFLLMAGFGFDAHVVKKVEEKDIKIKLLKSFIHIIKGVPAFFSDKYNKMDYSFNNIWHCFYHGIFAISSSYAGSFKLGNIEKSKINAFLVEKNGKFKLLKAFLPLFLWLGFNSSCIRNENFKVNGATFCQIDGEYIELENKIIDIYIKENAINLIVP